MASTIEIINPDEMTDDDLRMGREQNAELYRQDDFLRQFHSHSVGNEHDSPHRPLILSELGALLLELPDGTTASFEQAEGEFGPEDLFRVSSDRLGETPYIVKGRLNFPLGEPSVLYGDGGQGKSAVAYEIAVAVATGQEIYDSTTRQGNVLILDFEMDWQEAGRRIHATARGRGVDHMSLEGKILYRNYRGRGIHALREEIQSTIEENDISLILIDSWERAFLGDSVKTDVVNEAVSLIGGLINNQPRSVIIIDHSSTSNPRLPGGNRGKRQAARMQYRITLADENKEKGTAKLKVELQKNNYEAVPPLFLDRVWDKDYATTGSIRHTVGGLPVAHPARNDGLSKDEKDALAAFDSDGPLLNKAGITAAVAKALRQSENAVKQRLHQRRKVTDSLLARKLIQQVPTPEGEKGVWFSRVPESQGTS